MFRRKFLVDLLLAILAFFFGYTTKKERENLPKSNTSMVLDKETNNITEKIEVLYKYRSNWSNVMSYGAVGDGKSHKVYPTFNTLAELRVKFPNITNSVLTRMGIDPTTSQWKLLEFDECAIQQAIQSSDPGIVYIPAGTYLCNIFLVSGIRIIGDGYATVLKPSRTRKSTYGIISKERFINYAGVENIRILGNPLDNNNCGIYFSTGNGTGFDELTGIWECSFKNIWIEQCGFRGLYLDAGNKYQFQQYSRFENIHVTGSGNAGVYLFGGVQNIHFDRLVCRNNKSHGLAMVAYLDGKDWYFPTTLKFTQCIFEGNQKVENTTTHGVYNEGGWNTFDTCWFEGNGLSDQNKESSGMYLKYKPTGEAITTIKGCRFANHYIDIFIFQGDSNSIEGNSFAYSPFVNGKKENIYIEKIVKKSYIGRNGYAAPFIPIKDLGISTIIIRNNIGGKILIPKGTTYVDFNLEVEEMDTNYYINPYVTWNTTSWITNKSTSGFRLNFENAPTVSSEVGFTIQ